MLTSDDKEYDISEDASQWQTGIKNMWKHIVVYDFKHIALIPNHFDNNDPGSICTASHYLNCVLEHDKLTNNDYLLWQVFVRRYGKREELESDAWLEEKLWKSLGPKLLAEVSSDFNELPNIQKGAISLIRLIINRMVQNNQESHRAMEDYIKSFSIRNYPGEDVTEACLRLKAITRSLGTDKLPTDIIHRILDGFAHASTPAFQNLCYATESMFSSTLLKSSLQREPLNNQLQTVLCDLESKYVDLRSGRKWLAIEHGNAATKSVFINERNVESEEDDDPFEQYQEYSAFTVSSGKQPIPFHIWVKDKTCHHCNQTGHIRPMCHKYMKDVQDGKVPPPKGKGTSFQPRPQRQQYPPTQKPTSNTWKQNTPSNGKPPTFSTPTNSKHTGLRKALISAAEAFTANGSTLSDTAKRDFFDALLTVGANSSSEYEDEKPCMPPDVQSDDDQHGHSMFLAALGCPKE